jgi:hypothetical protein
MLAEIAFDDGAETEELFSYAEWAKEQKPVTVKVPVLTWDDENG